MTAGKVTIHAGFVLTLCALVYLDQGGLLITVFVAAALHELGHYIPLRLLGGRVSRLVLTGGGASMISEQPMGYGRELVTVLGGPAVSLGCALLFSCWDGMMVKEALTGMMRIPSWQMPLAGMFLSHGVFNLLPVRGLDGGKALELSLNALGFSRTQTILTVTTVITSAALAVFCGFMALKTRNVSLLFAMIYLLIRR